MVNPIPMPHTVERVAAGDLRLAVETWNPQGTPGLLFAHGFGQTRGAWNAAAAGLAERSEEHTSELQSRRDLVCRLLLEKKKKTRQTKFSCKRAYTTINAVLQLPI